MTRDRATTVKSLENIVIALRPPARMHIGADGNGDGRFNLGAALIQTGFPPWPSCADLLIHLSSRLFCGVTYQVAAPYRAGVRQLASALDSRVVRYVSGDDNLRLPAYREQGRDIDFLQIAWADAIPDTIEPAQLGGDVWYYRVTHRSPEVLNNVVGYGIGDLSELCREHKIVLPRSFALPTELEVSAATVLH